MVTDYTRLNAHVSRLGHQFSCITEILQSIPAFGNFFAKFDAVNGYFQIALDEASSLLTTVLLPSGPFAIYESHNASMHHLTSGAGAQMPSLMAFSVLRNLWVIYSSGDQHYLNQRKELRSLLKIVLVSTLSPPRRNLLLVHQCLLLVILSILKVLLLTDPSRVEAIKNFPPPHGSNCFALLCRHGSTAGILLFFPHNYCYAQSNGKGTHS